ncbi:MAG: hypothetical protein AAGJ18_01305, partial [Bacteroidota bacterium]
MSNLIKNLLTICLCLLATYSAMGQAADLKLEYQTSPEPAIIAVGDTLQVRYEVSNTGLTDATGSQMTIELTGDFQIVETMASAGTFTSNIWNIDTVPAEESEVLLVFLTKTAEGLGTLEAEITQMTGGGPDPDSTPNNDDAAEDDFQSFCISTIREFYQPQVITLSAESGMTGVQWFRNDTLIVGADSIAYDASEEGIYYFNADGAPCDLGGCCPVQLREVPPPPCSVTATVSEITCNDNGTPTIATDDYIDFKITTDGISLGNNFSLSADMGTVTTQAGATATNLTYGIDTLFRMQNGAAGAGDIQIILTDGDSLSCKDTLMITDQGVCSTPVCNMVLNVSPDDCDVNDNTYELSGTVTFSTPPTMGTLTILVDGVAQQTFNAPFMSPQTIMITGLTSDGQLHSVTSTFSADADCQVQMNYAAPAPCMVSSTCTVSATVNVGSCEVATNTYGVSGNVTFSDAPTTGTLKVAIGPFEQVFTAPFFSPQAYTISGLGSDGGSHDLVVSFSEDAFCRYNTSYTAPAGCDPVACGITATANPDTCVNNRFDLTGAITFTNAPSTGELTVSLGGRTQTFAAPFTAPQAYTFTGLLADGSAGEVMVQFSDDLACAATIDYVAPIACDMTTCAASLDMTASACSDNKFALTGSVATVNAPNTGTLTIQSNGTTYLTVNMPASSPIGFTIPGLPADGQMLTFNAVFSADANCTDTFMVVAPASCTGACDVNATVADVQCNDNGTTSIEDDYTTFTLNPTGTNLGSTYKVTASSGSVYLLSGALADNVPYGQATTFRLANGSSGGGDVTVTIMDNATNNCMEGPLTIPDPEVCSCEEPVGTIATNEVTCNGSNSNEDARLILISLTAGDRVNYSTGATYTGSADYANATPIGTLPDTLAIGLSNPTDSQAYTIRVFNGRTACFADTTIYLYEQNCNCVDPVITALRDESVCVGNNFTAANITTSVTNGVSVTYQWFDNNGTNNAGMNAITGQTTATLTNTPTAAGSYSYKVVATNTDPGGCTAEAIVNLTVLDTLQTPISQDICQGDSFNFNSQTLTAAGTYRDTMTAANGCDSFVVLTLNVLPTVETPISQDICQGDAYTF